jgi:hypothetical protein
MVIFKDRTIRSVVRLMNGAVACFVVLFLVGMSVEAKRSGSEPVALILHPTKAPEAMRKYELLPKTLGQINVDAVPLYEKAAQSLPKNLNMNQIRQWVETPPGKLPREQVRSTLNGLRPTLQLVEQAIKRKPLSWPPFQQGTLVPNLSEYQELGYILALQARLQIAEGQYEQAIATIQTGFAMAKQIGESSTVTQGTTGVAIAVRMCRQLEQFIQYPDAPSLYGALQALPRPLVDLNVPMKIEMSNLESSKQYHVIARRALKRHLESSHTVVRMLMNRLDRHVAALQCIEALRLYAGAHNGTFPNELSDVTEVPIPNDPIDQKPFIYHRTGSKAALEAEAPNGAKARFALRYLLNVEK